MRRRKGASLLLGSSYEDHGQHACLAGENCKYNGGNNRNEKDLQSRSPSYEVKQRYDGAFTGTRVDGASVTAELLMENGFRCVDVEDL